MPRSRIRGSIHPLLHTPSWRGAYLVIHRDNFTLVGSHSNYIISLLSFALRFHGNEMSIYRQLLRRTLVSSVLHLVAMETAQLQTDLLLETRPQWYRLLYQCKPFVCQVECALDIGAGCRPDRCCCRVISWSEYCVCVGGGGVHYDPAKDHQKNPCDSCSTPRYGLHINYIINVSSRVHN
jgi:hypothetical protein